jgi:hypothetical protein
MKKELPHEGRKKDVQAERQYVEFLQAYGNK